MYNFYFIVVPLFNSRRSRVPGDISVVTAKGQVVIPAKLRRRFGIKQGTAVSFAEDNGRLIIQPITQDFIRSLRGSLRRGTAQTAGEKG
jgi:AbrB family looped-hinge helix DNA binding protein